MKQDYLPLPITTATDEMAFDVYNSVYRAWQMYQDKQLSARQKARAEAYIKRLWAFAKEARKGPRGGGLKNLAASTYDQMLPLAHEALEEYRDEERMNESEDVGILERRTKARDAAIELILERLVPERRRMESETRKAYRDAVKQWTTKRNNYRDKMESWNWLNRRADGLARDLTAFHLGIQPGSVHVLRFRSRG